MLNKTTNFLSFQFSCTFSPSWRRLGLTENLQLDVRRRPLVADAVVGLADVGAGLVAVHGLDDERLGATRLLAARQQVVLQRHHPSNRMFHKFSFF